MNETACTTASGQNIIISYNDETFARLCTTCFRQSKNPVPQSGRIFRWGSLAGMLKHKKFLALFLTEIDRISLKIGKKFQTHLTMRYPEPVGWSTTTTSEIFFHDELEPYVLDEDSTCSRVKLNSLNQAPLTHYLTFACVIVKRESGIEVVIYSLYPGPYFAKTKGNVTEKTGYVLFRYGHPGETLPAESAT